MVVAAPDGVDQVVEGGHAVPAAGQRHGLPLQPRVTTARQLVAQDVSAVRPDLIVVTPRDVDDATVDCPGVSVGQPKTKTKLMASVSRSRSADLSPYLGSSAT